MSNFRDCLAFKIYHFSYIHSIYLQFIREYTGKVDELIKDKIEAQSEIKAKEKEEKDVIAQQVACFLHTLLCYVFFAQLGSYLRLII